ncbi:hypothetical protein [Agrobacterium pusense]|uniref:hypothetical protein n=1 Tax=Agrobacterium pusense TaxID=648995 RepID=UPI00289650B8|nr:hypothetical protein [Agrobacterium pusense]
MEKTKLCTCCKIDKDVSDFPRHSRNKDGLNTRCKPCSAAKTREWRQRNPEGARASEKRWREKNAERVREYNTEWSRAWRVDNRDRDIAASRRWKSNNPERVKEYARQNAKDNPERYAAHAAKRRADVLRATPLWLTETHLQQIAEFYKEARRLTLETGVKHHVDHIAPLKGRKSCGLHVPWNLQVLTAEENQRKWINEAA